jgi:hypothetical protein
MAPNVVEGVVLKKGNDFLSFRRKSISKGRKHASTNPNASLRFRVSVLSFRRKTISKG